MAVAKVVPRRKERFEIHGTGDSFVDRGQYYLHDKKARTSNRVGFTHTENLPTGDPQQALKFMDHTAMRAEELKAQAGRAPTGRKRQRDAVYIYSLSWHPEEAPTREEMIDAARQTLKSLKMQDREALFVAHNDEPHSHIHIIVNRVSAENGLAANIYNDHLKLSRWAQKYEKQRGKIYCPQRVANNNRRDRGEFVKHRPLINTADFRRWQKAQSAEALARGPSLELDIPEHHRAERKALHDAKEKRITQRLLQIRETNRSKWGFLFRQQKAEQRELDKTRRNAIGRVLYWLSHRQEIKTRGGLTGAFQALLGHYGPDFADAMRKRHHADRKALGRKVDRQITEALARENNFYQTELDALKQGQAAELQTFRDEHESRKQEAEWQREEKRTKPVKEQFEDRVRKRVRKARKKRDERGKGQGRERD